MHYFIISYRTNFSPSLNIFELLIEEMKKFNDNFGNQILVNLQTGVHFWTPSSF